MNQALKTKCSRCEITIFTLDLGTSLLVYFFLPEIFTIPNFVFINPFILFLL